MSLTLDPFDFPLIQPAGLGLAVHLFPVTKVQFEYFLGEARGRRQFDPSVYAEMKAINPRTSWRKPLGRPETLFATAILPVEIESYVRWLGDGYRLPTDLEWKAIDASLAQPVDPQTLEKLAADESIHPAARALLAASHSRGESPQFRELGMFEKGLLEWVRVRDGYRLQGRVRPELYRIIHNPRVHDAIRVQQDPPPRHKAFGFRLVKDMAVGGRL